MESLCFILLLFSCKERVSLFFYPRANHAFMLYMSPYLIPSGTEC